MKAIRISVLNAVFHDELYTRILPKKRKKEGVNKEFKKRTQKFELHNEIIHGISEEALEN